MSVACVAATDGAKPQKDDPDLSARLAEARRLHLTNSTRSRQLAEEALALARTREDERHEAIALVELAIALRRQNHNGIAVQHVTQGLALAEKQEDRAFLRRAIKETGHTYWAFGDNATALGHFQRALQLAEEDGDLAAQSDGHAGIGAVCNDLNDYARAKVHQKRSLELAEQAGERSRIAMYSSNFGNAAMRDQDYATARRLFERALAIFRELDRRTDADDSRADLARVDKAEGKLESAEKTLREILPHRRRLRGKIKLTVTLVELAAVLRLRGQLDEALTLLQEANGYADELAAPIRITVLDGLAELYETRQEYPLAIAALRKRQDAALSQHGEAAQKRAAELREAFEAERRETEIARLRQTEKARADELRLKESELARKSAELRARQAEIETARNSRYALASGLGAGLLALGAFVALLRVRLSAERRIHAETRVAKETAEQADQVKTRFLGIASHDIRGPLGNIVNLTTLLRNEKPGSEAHLERCDLIGSEAQRVISLVEDLITTAALEHGKLELRIAPLNLGEVAQAAIESLRWQADAKRQRILFSASSGAAGQMNGDASRLQQVIANLLGNAIKFSPPGETVTVTLTRRDNKVLLAVRDRGAGLAEADIPRLFTPFQRLAASPTAGESSHGLGLSIAQEITRRHGGVIRVESQPGDGATFLLELPADPSP